MERCLITKEGYERIKTEIEILQRKELPNNTQAIAEARAHGDLSENAEFHAAKEHQAILLSKIAKIKTILENAEIVDPIPNPNGRVVFGAKVKVYDTITDKELHYRILGQVESDPDNNLISISSPIAKALLGHEEGDEVHFDTPGGSRTLEIMKISK